MNTVVVLGLNCASLKFLLSSEFKAQPVVLVIGSVTGNRLSSHIDNYNA